MSTLNKEKAKTIIIAFCETNKIASPKFKNSKDTGIWESIYVYHQLQDGNIITFTENSLIKSLNNYLDKLIKEITYRSGENLPLIF
jgi:hypothetical protein